MMLFGSLRFKAVARSELADPRPWQDTVCAALTRLEGVKEVTYDPADGRVRFTFFPSRVGIPQIIREAEAAARRAGLSFQGSLVEVG